MALFNFRHGIARRQEDGVGNAANLQPSNAGAFIDLIVSPDPTIFTIAHYDENYLITENATVSKAWGPFTSGTDYWLYWDVDFITGFLTRGFSLYEPVSGFSPPPSPAVDQHWFDRNENVMKVWTGSVWIEKLRVFVCKYQSGATIVDFPIGTQVGISGGQYYAGVPLFDPDNKPLQQFQRNRRGRFITTETPLSSQYARVANFRVEAAIVQGEAQENIPIHHAITYSDYNELVLARSTVPDRPVIGLSAEEMNTGEARTYITKGFVTNDIDFDWSGLPVNTPLFLGPTGELTATPPTSGLVQEIARVIDTDTVFVDIKLPINLDAGTGNFVPIQIDRDTGVYTAKGTVGGGDCPKPVLPGSPVVEPLCAWGYYHDQPTPDTTWLIQHNFGTEKLITQIYDLSGEEVFPDQITIVDINTVQVDFNSPQDGRANLVLFIETS